MAAEARYDTDYEAKNCADQQVWKNGEADRLQKAAGHSLDDAHVLVVQHDYIDGPLKLAAYRTHE